ncbi:MAG: ABC transporter substrate-binding protein [Flavobacteriales bacterium]|nr:ABC transporter substrate-binding protein [Flavobacteriales bacterium]
MERELNIKSVPKRIVSLVPSITELLYDLHLEEEVVGLTKFCVHPKPWCNTKIKIGGTKKINLDRIAELQPDLIIGNKEENTKEDITDLQSQYPVLMTDVNSFTDALNMISLIGNACNRNNEALQLREQLEKIQKGIPSRNPRNAIYLIWKEPYFAVGQNTFINNMMDLAGFENLIKEERYPEITLDQINNYRPEFLLLSTEPYPFDNNILTQIKTHLTYSKPILVNGEMFSWYGSRLLKSFTYFEQLNNELDKN